MTLHNQSRIDLLIFAIDPALRVRMPSSVRAEHDEESADDSGIHIVKNAGDALRAIFQYQPLGLMVWVTQLRLADAAMLIEAIRRRRPELPLLAITPEHDPDVERAVRAAGAAYYFAIDGEADPPLLRQTLEALGLSRSRASPGTRPPSRAGPSRIRGRPPAVFRSP